MSVRSLLKSTTMLVAAAAFTAAASSAFAFDRAGYTAKVNATLADLKSKSLSDSAATLAQLDSLVALGIEGMKEYAAKDPKYAKLMEAAIADASAMKGMTDPEIEDKWGEKGTGGDAVGVPLKSLEQFGEPRAYLELAVGPSHAYIFVKKWESAKKARWLEQASDELTELNKHLEKVN